MSILYEKFKKYQVPASSVEDFRRRYTKPDRLTKRGPAYAAAVIQAAQEDFARFGYTLRLPATILHSSAIPSSAATTA